MSENHAGFKVHRSIIACALGVALSHSSLLAIAGDLNLEDSTVGILSCQDGRQLQSALESAKLKSHLKLPASSVPAKPSSPPPKLTTFYRTVTLDGQTIDDCYHTIPNACDPEILNQKLLPAERERSMSALKSLVETEAAISDLKLSFKERRSSLAGNPTALDDLSRETKLRLRELEENKKRFQSEMKKRIFVCSCSFSMTPHSASSSPACDASGATQDGSRVLYQDVQRVLAAAPSEVAAPTSTLSVERLSCGWRESPLAAAQPGKWEKFLIEDLHMQALFSRLNIQNSAETAIRFARALDESGGADPREIPTAWSLESQRQVAEYLEKHPELKKGSSRNNGPGWKVLVNHGIGGAFQMGNMSIEAVQENQGTRASLKYSSRFH